MKTHPLYFEQLVFLVFLACMIWPDHPSLAMLSLCFVCLWLKVVGHCGLKAQCESQLKLSVVTVFVVSYWLLGVFIT